MQPPPLVLNLLAQLAVTPVADLLLAFGFQPFAIGHIPHVAQRQRAGLLIYSDVHHRPTHLMLNVAGAPLLLGEKAILPALKFLPLAGTFHFRGL